MRPSKLSLVELFERQRRYVVPLFQRPYVWTEEDQWVPLWQDIERLAEAILQPKQVESWSDRIGNHFLGAVVLNQIKVFGRQVDAAEVIDGQQRLTTLQIMFAAFRDLVSTTEEPQLSCDLQRLTENVGVHENEDECFKVWPTNADRLDFVASMTAGSVEKLERCYPLHRRKWARKPDPRPLLIETYLFFAGRFREFCFQVNGTNESNDGVVRPREFSADRAHALYGALRRHIQIVVIELEEDDDPQVIFETMNARGVPLLPSDLIRNFVFLRSAQQGENANVLYASWWSEYDERPAEAAAGEGKRFWKQKERQGRVNRTRLDLFLHHYVQYQSGQDLGIGYLFKAFRGWWEEDESRTVTEELKVLRQHSDVFANLFVPDGDSRVDLFATRLKALDTTTLYPVLLMLLVGGRERIVPGDLDGIVTDLESYLVRRMVCDLGTKNYNRFFLSLLQRLRSADRISRSLIQKFLLDPEGTAGEWPDDRQLERAWLEKPAYETMKGLRCAMVLSAIDRSMRDKKRETCRVVGITSKLTVEHVLPVSWEAAWSEPTEPEGKSDTDESRPVERRSRRLRYLSTLARRHQSL